MGKGEIGRYEQFLLFSQYFQKTFTADTKKPGLVWERVNGLNILSACYKCILAEKFSGIMYQSPM